eukprot:gene68523-93893_t
MIPNSSAGSDQLSVLAKVLDEYCRQAGIAAGHAARERLGCRVMELFPGMADPEQAVYWTGLRPATPSNVPYIGVSKISNLYLNTGH